jgi:hypothetical protein
MKPLIFLTLAFCSLCCMDVCGQEPSKTEIDPVGKFEGMFMIEFRTVVKINRVEDKLAGNIKMFNGEEQLQDDALTEVRLDDHTLMFYIPAKETEFKGSFNEDYSEFSGTFTFPDGSEHPFEARKI